MDKRELYAIWAPADSVWSPWAKPVLFAHYESVAESPPSEMVSTTAAVPTFSDRFAIVVDLPGAESVAFGMALARQGYRPVPLFNACPAPPAGGSVHPPLIDVDSILAALAQSAGELQRLGIAPDAVPAFLLDADRNSPRIPLQPGAFDNRSVLFATDFPSAVFLRSHVIETAVVLHRGTGLAGQSDLIAALRPWYRGGIVLLEKQLDADGAPRPLSVHSPWGPFQTIARRFWAMMNLRRHPGGGYGGIVPEASSAAGG